MARSSSSGTDSTAALIMAAGGSARLGTPKALLPWRGESLLRHVVETALASACARVFVVLGADADALAAELRSLDITIVRHLEWKKGLGASIAAGIKTLVENEEEAFEHVLLMLGDQPFVTPELLDELLTERPHPIVASRYGDTLGPPALFDRSTFSGLCALEGDRGAKALLMEAPDRVAHVAFPDGRFDIDTAEDYGRALEALAEARFGKSGSAPEGSTRSD